MSKSSETAFRYRHRAEEIRIIAADIKDPKMHSLLVGVAEDYEKMAGTMQKIADGEKSGLRKDPK